MQNVLPPELRVGYETYTADGHYAPLALAFLADALVAGFGEDEPPGAAELDARPAVVRVEGAPTHRGAAPAVGSRWPCRRPPTPPTTPAGSST